MKKTLSILLLIVLMFSLTITAFAETADTNQDNITQTETPNISEEEAIKLAKQIIKTGWNYNIEDSYTPEVSFVESDLIYVNDSYEVSWTISNDNLSLYINVLVDTKDGLIQGAYFDKYDYAEIYENENKEFSVLTNDEAKIIAENFIKKINPKMYREVELRKIMIESNNYENCVSYQYYYLRNANGKSVDRNFILVFVDGISRQVTRYICQWDDYEFKAPKSVMNKYQAKKMIEESIGLKLKYKSIYPFNDLGDNEFIITYEPVLKNAIALDAEQGVLIDINGKVIDSGISLTTSEAEKKEIFSKTTKANIKSVPINKERALEIFSQNIEKLYGNNYKFESIEYIDDNDKVNYFWIAHFIIIKNDGDTALGYMKINAFTEEFNRISLADFSDFDISTTTDDQWKTGYDKAIDIIAQYYPEKIYDINTEIGYEDKFSYEYVFPSNLNGIEFDYNGISIYIDKSNQNVLRVSINWEEYSLPSDKDIITLKDAYNKYFAEHDFELFYAKINTSGDLNNPEYEYKLIYSLPNNYYQGNIVDAKTGNILDKFGVKTEEDFLIYDPDLELNRYQALEMVINEVDYNEEYYTYSSDAPLFTDISEDDKYFNSINSAVKYGLIDNVEDKFRGNEKISRQELAELLVRALGYHDIAKINNLYKTSFSYYSKIDKDRLGHVAICNALKIMKTDKNKFRPNDSVKNIEMAISLCYFRHYLNK